VELGVRPEHVRLKPSADGSGVVEVVETAGNETLVHVTVGNETVVARVPPELRLDVGQRVAIQASEQDVYLFDAETGLLVRGLER
jgi:multiple sugar transport system ATP-binding protein